MKCDELEVYDMASNADLSAGYDHHWAYDKDEADEAFAELKEEIKKTQELANEQTFKLCVEKENVCQLEQLFRKQKYKRCLKLSKCCHLKSYIAYCERDAKSWERWRKWYYRWRYIADKLKENKNE